MAVFFHGHACSGDRGRGGDAFASARSRMIEHDLKARDITDPAVLGAMETVPRHRFVPESLQHRAYDDCPLPIGEGQTISQPYIVALMTQSLALDKDDRVLEIGTGSGYQAAVLGELAGQVFSVEIVAALAQRASRLLRALGYENVSVRAGDGFFGWKEHAPYDAIILTCAAPDVPPALVEQLREGGKIILPLGRTFLPQSLVLGTKKGARLEIRRLLPVRFVPMTGRVREGT